MSDKKVGVGFGVMILNDTGQVLLGKRHEDPDKADSELAGEGTWTMPGGKLEYGEDFIAGAVREVAEETGMELQEAQIICVNNDKNEHAHFVTNGLLAQKFVGEPQVLEPDEITEWQWFPLDALPEKVFFPSANVLECYHKKLVSL